MTMDILVTGATGHVGSYVVHLLVSQGHRVVAASRSGTVPLTPFEKKASFPPRTLKVDITQDAAVAILEQVLPAGAAIVHLAAWHPPATAKTTADDRRQLLETNVLGTMRVSEAARRAQAGCMMYASTFEVYGESQGTKQDPITEQTRVNPITDYGASKLAGEDHLFSLEAEDKIRTVSLRMPAVYGPGEHTSRALPNFLRSVAEGRCPILRGDGTDLRDELHGDDAASAISAALHSHLSGIFNINDGEAHSIEEIALTAMRVGGLNGMPERQPGNTPPRNYHMTIEKAVKTLTYQPRVSLEVGMAQQFRAISESKTLL